MTLALYASGPLDREAVMPAIFFLERMKTTFGMA